MRSDFIFLQPTKLEDAASAFLEEASRGKQAVYWGGGTELLSMARQGKITPDIGIDLKKIPELTVLEQTETHWILGAGLPLNAMENGFTDTCLFDIFEGVADHTVRNRLTIGGNLCGRLPYRETMVPLLVLDASATVFGAQGLRSLPFRELVSRGRLSLDKGEFLVSVEVEKRELAGSYACDRRTGTGPVAYPLVTLLLKPAGKKLKVGHSGLLPVPGYQEIPWPSGGKRDWASKVIHKMADRFRNDAAGSDAYRRALAIDALEKGAERLAEDEKK